jgi:predicted transcriptional regulator
MVCAIPKKPHVFVLMIICFGVLFYFLGQPLISNTYGQEESSFPKIAVFYGSDNDRQLCEEMTSGVEVHADFFNISQVQLNSSFTIDNESINAIWWVNELPLPIDFSFVGDLNNWTQKGNGLFILNQHYSFTPAMELLKLGITGYWPESYPLNDNYQTHTLQLNNETIPSLGLNQLSYDFNGSSSWVRLTSQSKLIGKINKPENEPYLSDLDSGLWLVKNRVIVGSFSVVLSMSSFKTNFKLMNIHSPEDMSFSALLGNIAFLTTTSSPNNSGNFLISDIDQIAAAGIISFATIISFIGFIKLGIFSKLREIITGIIIGSFMFLAHIAYSPQKRRISEDDLLDNKMRLQIVEYLEEKGEQGAHLREIQRTIGCGISSLLWHLQALDDFNIVTHHKIGKYHIFYLSGTESPQTSEIALALKSDVAKELCRVLIRKMKPLPLSKISSEIDVHHSSIQHHIKKLSDLGVILILKEKKRSAYIINPSQTDSLTKLIEVA